MLFKYIFVLRLQTEQRPLVVGFKAPLQRQCLYSKNSTCNVRPLQPLLVSFGWIFIYTTLLNRQWLQQYSYNTCQHRINHAEERSLCFELAMGAIIVGIFPSLSVAFVHLNNPATLLVFVYFNHGGGNGLCGSAWVQWV